MQKPDEPPLSPVLQMRVVLTAEDYAGAVRFYRDALGLTQLEAFSTDAGDGIVLAAGVATLEILDPGHAAFVDSVEVGDRVAGPVRLAFEVADTAAMTDGLVDAGATLVAPPAVTPWNSLNSRLDTPTGMQLTLFTELG